MEGRHQRTVRVSDLDKMGHMTKLRYIEMFQDAHDSQFWKALNPVEMEIFRWLTKAWWAVLCWNTKRSCGTGA